MKGPDAYKRVNRGGVPENPVLPPGEHRWAGGGEKRWVRSSSS